MAKEGVISGAYISAEGMQVGSNINIHNENYIHNTHVHSLSKKEECVLSWEILIKCAKDKYKAKSQIKTLLGEAQEIASCYVNLAIVGEKEQQDKEQKLAEQQLDRESWLNSYEEIHGTKIAIRAQDIFVSQVGKELKRQLILGQAGIGKSVLCQYLAYQWAKEGWWKEESFKLLVWIPLHQLANEKTYLKEWKETITLGKVFYEQFKEQMQNELPAGESANWIKTLDDLINEHRSEILYMLDGFDEVAHICQLDGSQATRVTNILSQLLKQKQIVITSRPYYIDNYLNTEGIKINRCLENIGFVDKDVQDYIHRFSWKTAEQQKSLQSLMANNSLIRGIAYIPINLALLCRYWNTQTLNESHVISMTDLYEGLVGDLLYEYLGKGKGYIDFADFTTISVLNNKQVQPILQFLEKLAFLQMQEESLLISKERIADLLEECQERVETSEWQGFKSVLDAGLLISPDEQEKRFEDRKEHYFIHLTFQEFLAARYIARLFKKNDEPSGKFALLVEKKPNQSINNRSLELFMQHHKYDLRYEIVWWFVAGLLKRHKEGIERFFNSLLSEPRSLSGWYDVLLWIKCLEEMQLTNNLDERLKKNLIEEIRKMAQAALDSRARISDKQYSKTFFEYLYSSSIVYEKLGILQTQEAVKETLDILRWYSNLPISVVEKIGQLLSDKDRTTRISALDVLSNQSNLSANVLHEMVRLLSDKNWNVRSAALSALEKQSNLLDSVLHEMVKLLSDEDWTVRRSALSALEKQPNLSDSVLHGMVRLLSDEDWDVISSALSVLSQQPNLSDSILNEIVRLLDDKDGNVKSLALLALKVLGQQPSLPNSVLNETVKLLSHKDCNIRSSALDVLGQRPNLSDSVLNEIVKLLGDKEWDVRSSALEALGKQQNLSDSILGEIVKSLGDDEGEVRRSVLATLGQQSNLSASVFNKMVRLLRDRFEDKTISQIQNSQAYEEETSLVSQQLALMPDNQVLQSQPFLNSKLLSNIILENTFSSKDVAYFENDQLLIIRLGQQLKKNEIKDKNEFISVFIEQHKLWLNNRNTEYLLTLKEKFKHITIA